MRLPGAAFRFPFRLELQLLLVLCIPPPVSAKFPANVQLVTVGLPPLLNIPPPVTAEFSPRSFHERSSVG